MKGILLVNLGSPDSPEVKDVRRYLGEFLMDERVIDIPFLFRFLLVKGIIVNTRSKNSAAAYAKIWTDEGSPLIVNSEKLAKALQSETTYPIALSMRYGEMSIAKGFEELHGKGVDEILLVPLYPQHAMSSTETAIEKAKEIRAKQFPEIRMEVLPAFYDQEDYLSVLTSKVKKEMNPDEFMVFSYHGLPERQIKKLDVTKSHCLMTENCCTTPSPAHKTCYRHQSFKITSEMVKRLGLKENQYVSSFQSRLGNDPWLLPATDETLKKLARNGLKNVQVIAPSFVADCLETVEELAIENRDYFMGAGGQNYHYISCLNHDSSWVQVLKKWCEEWVSDTVNVK